MLEYVYFFIYLLGALNRTNIINISPDHSQVVSRPIRFRLALDLVTMKGSWTPITTCTYNNLGIK